MASLGAVALALALAGPVAAQSTRSSSNATWLGVSTQELTYELEEGLDYNGPGVLVNRVIADSPAERAGILKGDILVRLNSRQVDTPDELASLVQAFKIGDKVSIQVVRDGEKLTLPVTLGARERSTTPAPRAPRAPRTPEPPEAPEAFDPPTFDFDFHGPEIEIPEGGVGMFRTGRGRLGVRIESLNEQLGDYFGVPQGKGVLIVEVLEDTPAERAGLKAGDIVTAVDAETVSDSDDLIQALAEADTAVKLTVIRKGVKQTLTAQLEQRRSPRVLRLRRGDGIYRWNEDSFTRGLERMGRIGVSGKTDAEIRRELKELQDELRELKKEMEELKSD